MRLAGTKDIAWENRVHFFALAAEVMRNVLVDSARRRRAAKRGSGAGRTRSTTGTPKSTNGPT